MELSTPYRVAPPIPSGVPMDRASGVSLLTEMNGCLADLNGALGVLREFCGEDSSVESVGPSPSGVLRASAELADAARVLRSRVESLCAQIGHL